MPEVEVSIHGVTVKLASEHGDIEWLAARAVITARVLQEQWREINYSGMDSQTVAISADGEPDNDKTTNEVTT